jgi:hypothetical protein
MLQPQPPPQGIAPGLLAADAAAAAAAAAGAAFVGGAAAAAAAATTCQIMAIPGPTPDAPPVLLYLNPATGAVEPLPEHLVMQALTQLQAAGAAGGVPPGQAPGVAGVPGGAAGAAVPGAISGLPPLPPP